MRYICEHCGAGGATPGESSKLPATYHCHVCPGKDCMWPEPIMRKLADAQTRVKELEQENQYLRTRDDSLVNTLTEKESSDGAAL